MIRHNAKYRLQQCMALLIMMCFLISLNAMTSDSFDPYAVLGVKREASEKDIRRAYKALARKWHPDKNKNPRAQDMFVKITDAYNILGNEERKYRYDTFGTITDDPNNSHERGFRNGFGFQGFHSFDGFHSFFGGTGSHNIQILTDHIFENTVLPMSHKAPQLIYVYGDWCFQCMQLEVIWESTVNDLKSLGVGAYELNFQYSRKLNSKLNVNHYPQFLAVTNGRIFKYTANEFSNENLRAFIHRTLPRRIVKLINTDTYLEFFRKSFISNKPQAILFSNKMEVPLLFSLIAFEYYQKLEFAYVNSEASQNDELRKRYGVHQGEQVFFIMKEEPSNPEVILKDSSLKQKAIRKAISGNLFFYLPRLSSPEIFDGICPVSNEYQPNYCVMLFTISSQDHSYHRFILRKLAKDKYWRQNGVHFMYISEDVQRGFSPEVEKYGLLCKNGEPALKLLVFLRQSTSRILFEWVDGGWCVDEPDDALNSLKGFLNVLLDREKELVKEYNISYIYDEHQPHIFIRLVNQLNTLLDYISDSYKSFNWYSPTSLVLNTMLLGIIFLAGVLLPMTGRSTSTEKDEAEYSALGISKLTARNYKKLTDKSLPGRFTVVILLDIDNFRQLESSPIMQAFSDATYSFTRGDTFTFAWISIQEQLSWCAEVMDVKEFGKVLPGTILALNGRRKYIHIFKPSDKVNIERSADFIGLESDHEEEDEELVLQAHRNQKLTAQSIRVLLPLWLDRLCDGTLSERIKLDSWPSLD